MAPNNSLTIHGNEKTMNLNHLLLTNIQSSNYFKIQLYELKTYHQVVDEIYYKVSHLEPWEKGSRKTAGQTGMCGGVRGVGAGGIVSSCFCLLYKLFTLRLTRKQVVGLITHTDSPYIRGLGFMYIRYTQPPADLWDWMEEYLEDEEEIDVKAGGGHVITIGQMVRQFMTKLEWYSTLFPRIPVPVEKVIHAKFKEYDLAHQPPAPMIEPTPAAPQHSSRDDQGDPSFGEAARISSMRARERSHEHDKERPRDYDRHRRDDRDYDRRDRERDRDRHDRDRRRRSRSRSRDRRRSRSRERKSHKKRSRHSRSRSRDRHRRHRSRSPRYSSRDQDEPFEKLLHREKERQYRERYGDD